MMGRNLRGKTVDFPEAVRSETSVALRFVSGRALAGLIE